jgi:2,4-dienoyl-CoA reductase-like NADH-dependent reductase (Old Yellow Enzyme family)
MQAAGLDGVEFECYGHLMDQFISPLTNTAGRALWRQLRQPAALCHDGGARRLPPRVGPGFILGMRYVADEDHPGGITIEDGIEMARRFRDAGWSTS